MHVQAANVSTCQQSGSPAFGVALLTTGTSRQAHDFTFNTQYLESRGIICMGYGNAGTEGYACSTHLQPTIGGAPPLIKMGQWMEFYDVAKFIRGGLIGPCASTRVIYAGDFYLTSDEIVLIEASRGHPWASWNIDADPQARETQYNTGRQIDHVMSWEYMRRNAPAALDPGNGVPYPTTAHPADHRLVVSHIDVDTNPCGR